MKRTPLRRRASRRAKGQLRRTTPLRRTPSMAATDVQRAAVAGRACIVCGADTRIDPAHLSPRGLGGCGDRLCVIPACRDCHRAYDRGELDLLPYLEPAFRAQLAHAVGHVGLVGALRRISGTRSAADRPGHKPLALKAEQRLDGRAADATLTGYTSAAASKIAAGGRGVATRSRLASNTYVFPSRSRRDDGFYPAAPQGHAGAVSFSSAGVALFRLVACRQGEDQGLHGREGPLEAR